MRPGVAMHWGGESPLVTDAQWRELAPLLPPRRAATGRPRADDRACLEGILWVMFTGAKWSEVPPPLPDGTTCMRRFHEWCDGSPVWTSVWEKYVLTVPPSLLWTWTQRAWQTGHTTRLGRTRLTTEEEVKATRLYLLEAKWARMLPPRRARRRGAGAPSDAP